MQELIINALLVVVIATAAVFLFIVGRSEGGKMTKKQKTMLVRILVSAALLLVLQSISAETFDQLDGYLFPSSGRFARLVCYLIDYFVIGYDILRKAIKGILNRQVFDENSCSL